MLTKQTSSKIFSLLLCYVFILQSVQTSVAQAIVFEIGEIPPQTVWVAQTQPTSLDFQLTATELGASPLFSFTDNGIAQGTQQLHPVTGVYNYSPDINDNSAFSVVFKAEKNGQSISQSVVITPLQELQPEQTAFGLEPGNPLPNPEDRRYLSITESKDPGTTYFNTSHRKLRQVVITGQKVVFEQGHPNGLWSYHDNKDLESLEIYADTVVFKSAMHLPQTNVTIYARNLRFEDVDGQDPGSISTLPDSKTTRPAQFNQGTHGHMAGSVSLYIDKFYADSSANKRFILTGGNGQPAGLGRNGTKGRSNSSNVKKIYGTAWAFCSRRTWSFTGVTVTYAKLTTSCSVGGTGTTNAGDPKQPLSGSDAIVGGKPGNGGDSGQLTSSVDLASALFNNSGGIAGTRANRANGGAPGTPRYSREVSCTYSKCTNSFTSTAYGRSYSGPFANIPQGIETPAKFIGKTYRWLTPTGLSMATSYIKDAYLYGHYDSVNDLLETYIVALDDYMASEQWSVLDSSLTVEEAQQKLDQQQAELIQAQDELLSLQQRLHSNLDYFGNPVGWSPLLSFEVNRAAFQQEIDVAMDVLWLNYWMSNGANSIAARQTAAQDMIATLKTQIDDYKQQYTEAVESIPRLQNEVENLAVDIEFEKAKIKALEQELLPKAKEAAVIRNIGRTLTKIAEVFPLAQPILTFAGNFITGIPDIDPDKPLEQALLNSAGASAGNALDEYWNEGIDGQLNDTATLLECAEKSGPLVKACVAMEGVQRLNELRKPVIDALGSSVKIIAGSTAADPAVREELNRILATDSRFAEIIEELKGLNTRKTKFAKELIGTIQAVNFLASALTKNMLAIDAMSEVVRDVSASLNPRTLAYLDGMAQRARHRLELYQYYMAKAYEYRLLKDFDMELDLNSLFADFCRLAIAIDENDLGEGLSGASCDTNTARNLTKADFDSLKAIYEDQLADIAFEILDEYNNNPSRELTGGVTFNVPTDILDQLNNEGTATLNLVDRLGLFSLREENLRLLSIEVREVEFDNLNNGLLNYMDICFIHSGLSKLRKEGETYLFRHYNHRATGLIEWRNRYDDGNISLLPLSAASNSLLGSLIGNDNPDLLLYSRPGAWADLTLRKESTGSALINITSMKVVVKYDFTDQNVFLKTLKLVTGDSAIEAEITIDTVDKSKSGRQNGRGEFLRSYDHGDQVKLTAPQTLGNYEFERWVGGANSQENQVTVLMNRNLSVLPIYKLVEQTDSDEDGVNDNEDNCLEFKNADQLDTDGDGYGNACDGDLNNDGFVNARDLSIFKLVYLTEDADADFNGDGFVNARDLSLLKLMFNVEPGPSANK